MKKILSFLAFHLWYAAFAQDQNKEYSFLNSVPEPDTIVQSITGDNLQETYARQFVALDFIASMLSKDIMDHTAHTTSNRNARESKLYKEYLDAQKEVMKNYTTNVEPLDTKNNFLRWNELEKEYLNDKAFKQKILNQFLSAGAKTKYNKTQTETQEELKAAQQEEDAQQAVIEQGKANAREKIKHKLTIWLFAAAGLFLMIISNYAGKALKRAYMENKNFVTGIMYGLAGVLFYIGIGMFICGASCGVATL